jgi:hypothetical protein
MPQILVFDTTANHLDLRCHKPRSKPKWLLKVCGAYFHDHQLRFAGAGNRAVIRFSDLSRRVLKSSIVACNCSRSRSRSASSKFSFTCMVSPCLSRCCVSLLMSCCAARCAVAPLQEICGVVQTDQFHKHRMSSFWRIFFHFL